MPVPTIDAAVFIGRFQPPHLAHLALLEHALQAAQLVVLVLGSAWQAQTPKNPFSWQERRDMIEQTLSPAQRSRVIMLPMPDFYNEARWVQQVKTAVAEAVKRHMPHANQPRIALLAHFKDASSNYLARFPGWQMLELPRQGETDATTVREILFASGQQTSATELQTTLAAHLHPSTAQWLLRWRESAAFANLQAEWRMLQSHRQSWAQSPYPPVFVTVDALVQCQGHVLLIERGQMPGKGLWALPGGFLEPRDTLWQSCLRELGEETGLSRPAAQWQANLEKTEIFDHPDRSLRGRTITHVFHFKLDEATLPAVQGADDAKEAMWVPLQVAAHNSERFFDDHFHILERMLGLERITPTDAACKDAV